MNIKLLSQALFKNLRGAGKDSNSSLHFYSKGGGLGDELMALCALQAVCRRHPGLDFTFHARNHALFAESPLVSEVQPFFAGKTQQGFGIGYEHKQSQPILQQMTTQIGVPDAGDFRLELPERPLRLPRGWPVGELPKVLIQTSASDWTPNKQWPVEHWTALIESLPHEVSIVEVGTRSALTAAPRHPGWQTLAGQTSLEEFVACFRAATVFAGPVSSGMHLSHAFAMPSVIMVGGYEAANFPYPGATQLGTNLPCAPCWLRTACPYDRQCLREITMDAVRPAIMKHLAMALDRRVVTDVS